MPKQIEIAAMERKRKRGRPRNRSRDEFEDQLNIMGMENRQAVVRDRWELRMIYWKP